jgi:hypothetical protein
MKTSVILPLVTLIAFSATVTAQNNTGHETECDENTQIVLAILGAIALLSIIYAYNLTQTSKGLESKIRRNKEIILKQRAEIRSNEEIIRKQVGELTAKQKTKVEEEIQKSKSKTVSMKPHMHRDRLQKEFWDKLDKTGKIPSQLQANTELEKLKEEYNEIKGLIDITKSKYYKRLIDESSFNEITREYQKRLIEIESKIAKLKKEGRKND